MAESIYYVYGVVPSAAPLSRFPDGLDDTTVVAERVGSVAALLSQLSSSEYSPAGIEHASASVEWLSPRAMAHDRVLTWASDLAPVIPFPMFSAIFSSLDRVQDMLRDRAPELDDTFARIGAAREYALRVYRIDAELGEALPELDEAFRRLANQAREASPGQRYLLERKLEESRRDSIRSVARTVVDEIRSRLEAHSVDTAVSPIPRTALGDAPGTMILNAAFLVTPDALPEFQQTVGDLVMRYQGRGFRFDFTGPWPPYHFAGGADGT